MASRSAQAMQRREFARQSVRARARVRIGNRFYAGYIEDISEGGARIATVSPIRDSGRVVLIVPDLEPVTGELRWSEGRVGGVQFHLKMDSTTLRQWLNLRIPRAA